jgi:hypothetical protein
MQVDFYFNECRSADHSAIVRPSTILEYTFPSLKYTFPSPKYTFPILKYAFPILKYAFPILNYAFPILKYEFPILEYTFSSPQCNASKVILGITYAEYLEPTRAKYYVQS